MSAQARPPIDDGSSHEEYVFERLAQGLMEHTWCAVADALPPALTAGLFEQLHAAETGSFVNAGVGRSSEHAVNRFVRRDQIRWIEGDSQAEADWLAWCGRLQTYLNRRLFLGLFSFESHFAHYRPGDFYRKHVDAFRPAGTERGARRVLSLVAYLNPAWQLADGGELAIYDGDGREVLSRVLPCYGSLVVFLSTEVPHEVLPARRDRYSIAGWFRVNGSVAERPDPPR